MDFWDALNQLIAASPVVIDRPQGSAHPRWPDIIYPLDYGYLDHTTGGDGSGIDIWRGSGNPKHFTGVICTVDVLKRDSEVKVLLGCIPDDVQCITTFYRNNGMGYMVIENPASQNVD